MTVDQYVQDILQAMPTVLKDAFDPQRIQTVLARRIADNYGATNRTPTYPREPKGTTLQYVTGNLFKAATVYKAAGNASRTVAKSDGVSFEWEVDLSVIPYARIHEYGGETGRNKATTIPARPYIGPAIKAFQDEDLDNVIDMLLRKLIGGK
jgi:phage gpG-like protein